MRSVVLGGVAVAALVAGACSGGSGDDGITGPTVPPGGDAATTTTTSAIAGGGASTTSTSVAAASYEVPATIDQAYVQRVVSAYDKVLGDAIRVLKRDGQITDDFLKHLLGIYGQAEFEVQQRGWAEEASAGRPGKTIDNPPDPSTTVVRIERSGPDCLIVRADRAWARTLQPGVPEVRTAHDQYLVLVPKRERPDPLNVNPTPWVMSFDGSKDDNSVPVNSCGD